MRAIEDITAGRLAPDAAKKTIDDISRSPPSPTGLSALAAAAGAVALAVIFGVQKSHLFPKGALAIEYDYRRRFAREFLWKFFRNKTGN